MREQTPIYIAIIGDMIDSRKIDARRESQRRLKDALHAVNVNYEAEIASKFMVTLGDEFQGLLTCGGHIPEIISSIESSMYPVRFRFGIGAGGITTDINPDIPLGADGPAYYNARMMVDKLKANEKKNRAPDMDVLFKTEVDERDTLLNALFSLCAALKKRWTRRQSEVVYYCLTHGDHQLHAANSLGVSQSSIQKSLAGADYYTYKNAMDAASITLAQIGAQDNV